MAESAFIFIAPICLLLTGIWLVLVRPQKGGRFLLFAADEDIRIVTGSPSASLRAGTDSGESVAREFQRQKENGNVFMANRLGEELAHPLLEGEAELFGGLWQDYTGQMSFLYALAVREAIEKKVDNSILADTAWHSFLETVEDGSADIYRAINDSVADTIYRLCLADDGDVGSGFAKLCGRAQDLHLAREGAEAFGRFQSYSSRRIDRIPFR